jgi:hypothetical protein
MDHNSSVVATPKKDGWSHKVELLSLVRETLVAMMKAASCASSTMARP